MLTEAQIMDPIYDALVFANQRREWDGYIHVSDIPKCPMTWYRSQHGESLGLSKKDVSPSEAGVFMRGNGIHRELQLCLGNFGVLCAKELEVRHRTVPIIGSIDAILEISGSDLPVVYEFKTMDPDKFRMLGDSPEPEHEFQAMMYAFLASFGVDIDGKDILIPSAITPGKFFDKVSIHAAVVYFNTQYSVFKAYPIKIRMDVILRAIDKVKNYFDVTKIGLPPTQFLNCDREDKKCGNCRLNKKLVKEAKIV